MSDIKSSREPIYVSYEKCMLRKIEALQKKKKFDTHQRSRLFQFQITNRVD